MDVMLCCKNGQYLVNHQTNITHCAMFELFFDLLKLHKGICSIEHGILIIPYLIAGTYFLSVLNMSITIGLYSSSISVASQ